MDCCPFHVWAGGAGFVYPASVAGGGRYGQGDTIRVELDLGADGKGALCNAGSKAVCLSSIYRTISLRVPAWTLRMLLTDHRCPCAGVLALLACRGGPLPGERPASRAGTLDAWPCRLPSHLV